MAIQWMSCEATVSEETVRKIESQFDVGFPQAYRDIVKRCDQGSPAPADFSYQRPDGTYAASTFSALLSLNGNMEDNLLGVLDWLKEYLPERVVPFGHDGGGDYICFDYRQIDRQTRPSVVYWQHGEQPDVALVRLADSYEAFLELLCEDPPLLEG